MELQILLVDFLKADDAIINNFIKDFKPEGDYKTQQILSDISLRYMLSSFMPLAMSSWSFVKSPWGKPSIAVPGYENVKFNISHSGKHVALILAPPNCKDVINVGIDLEADSRCHQAYSLKDEFLSMQELNVLNSLHLDNVEKTALTCWTLKEAFSKAVGFGMAMPFRSIQLELQHGKLLEVDCFGGLSFQSSEFKLESLVPKAGFQMSYCVQSKTGAPIPIKINQISIEKILAAYCEKDLQRAA